MKPIPVLVAGSNYARNYVRALRLCPERYRVAGILARGSSRSEQLASSCNVPLFRAVDDVPAEIEIACVAISPAQREIPEQLLDRGIHTLCEHPLSLEYLAPLLRLSSRKRVCLHVNGHFHYLAAANAFVEAAAKLGAMGDPQFLEIVSTDRFLYGALDIVRHCWTPFSPASFPVAGALPPFEVVQGHLGGLRATLQLQTSGASRNQELADGSADYLIDFRLTLGFRNGVLTLNSIAGPLIWNWNYHRSGKLNSSLSRLMLNEAFTPAQIQEQRLHANLTAIDQLRQHAARGMVRSFQSAEHLLDVSRSWEAIGRQLEINRI